LVVGKKMLYKFWEHKICYFALNKNSILSTVDNVIKLLKLKVSALR